jgi:pilus assembly protein CpaF
MQLIHHSRAPSALTSVVRRWTNRSRSPERGSSREPALRARMVLQSPMDVPNQVPSSSSNPPRSPDKRLSGGLDFQTYQELKNGIHRYLQGKLELGKLLGSGESRPTVLAAIQEVVSRVKVPFSAEDRERFALEIVDEVFGLGPLEPLMQDPSISDILVNGPKQVYVERNGVLEETKVQFKDDAHLLRVIQRIVSAVGRRIDESSWMVDARLADGSRVNVVVPPLTIDGPHLSIRRFGHTPMTDADLLAKETMTPAMLGLLKIAVAARLNVVISGGTGAGKTTLLNVLSGYVSDKERIIAIEDSVELQLKQRHVVRMEAHSADAEGKGDVPVRQLVINSLRMRPNRIIVGEIRGPEALDMLQAMNTGHDGSLTTIHANSPRDALARMETMVMMANLNIAEKAIRRQIVSAISLVVQVARFSDGSRRLTHITEITGMESDVITMQDIFVFEKQGVSSGGRTVGNFTATGIRPKFADKLKVAGFDLPSKMFETGREWK